MVEAARLRVPSQHQQRWPKIPLAVGPGLVQGDCTTATKWRGDARPKSSCVLGAVVASKLHSSNKERSSTTYHRSSPLAKLYGGIP